MATYKDTILTNQGLIWADRAAHGLSNFKITRVSATSTDLTGYNDEKIKSLTKLPDYNFSGEIVETTKDNSDSDNLAETIVMFDNKNSKNSYYLRAIGLWATNTETKEEILYSVTVASYPDFLPSFDNKVYVQSKVKIQIIVGSNANVQITINPENIATVNYVNNTEEKLQTNINKKASIEQAQYSIVRELTDEDDLYHIDKNGRYLGNGVIPKNSPYKEKSWFLFEKNNFYAMFTDNGGDRFIVADYSKGWIKIPNENDMKQQYTQTKELNKVKFSWNAKQDAQKDSEPHIYKSQKDDVGFYQGGGVGTLLGGTIEVQQAALQNVNLNDVTKNGKYFIRGTNDVGTMPAGASNIGMLTVVGFESDIFQTYEDTRGSMYKRQYNYGGWREWKQIYYGSYY